MNSYELSRAWFDWCFENPDKVKPIHSAIYFFAIEHCNRLGWKKKFGFPSGMAMEALGIKHYSTYMKAFNELVDFGVIEVIQRSKNQYSANIIAISKISEATSKALEKAGVKHSAKQMQSTYQSNCSIDKQVTSNNEPINKEQVTMLWPTFDDWWDVYDKKVGRDKSEKKWDKLSQQEKENAMAHSEEYVKAQKEKKYRKNPETYLNNKSWNDEIIKPNGKQANTLQAAYRAARSQDN